MVILEQSKWAPIPGDRCLPHQNVLLNPFLPLIASKKHCFCYHGCLFRKIMRVLKIFQTFPMKRRGTFYQFSSMVHGSAMIFQVRKELWQKIWKLIEITQHLKCNSGLFSYPLPHTKTDRSQISQIISSSSVSTINIQYVPDTRWSDFRDKKDWRHEPEKWLKPGTIPAWPSI